MKPSGRYVCKTAQADTLRPIATYGCCGSLRLLSVHPMDGPANTK